MQIRTMSKMVMGMALLLAALCIAPTSSQAQGIPTPPWAKGTSGGGGGIPSAFTGLLRLSCECNLCLPFAGSAPPACASSLAYYFALPSFPPGIRQQFLNMCPHL